MALAVPTHAPASPEQAPFAMPDQEAAMRTRAETAVAMANQYPDIVKAIAVGNESMVQWAVKYFVYPKIILK